MTKHEREHFASAVAATTVNRQYGVGHSYAEPAWVVLCSCGGLFQPRLEGDTTSALIDGPALFRAHLDALSTVVGEAR